MKVKALERKQYGGFRAVIYNDVTEITNNKNGDKTILHFSDGGKVTKLSRLIKEVIK